MGGRVSRTKIEGGQLINIFFVFFFIKSFAFFSLSSYRFKLCYFFFSCKFLFK